MPIYKKVNKDFFKKWSREMAYVLGFFAADGTMIKNNRGAHFIEFHITDKEILLNIKKAMGSDHKISIRVKNPKNKIGYRIQIGSKEIFLDLQKMGFCPNKSKIIRTPEVPKLFLGDFIRGYFDGDGCVYFKKHKVKDRKNDRWVFSTRFTSGSRDFLFDMQKILKPYIKKGFIVGNNGAYELIFSHRDSVALFRLMYNNVTKGFLLRRKYILFKKAVNILYGK